MLVISAALATPAFGQERDPFKKGTVGIEFGAAALVEIWNLNGHREPMLEGSAAFWGAIRDRVAIGIEFQHGYVFQHTPGALVQGISPLVRWKIVDQPTWDWFVEAGPGVSWSDLSTPPRGTKFNYLFQAGAGVIKQTGSNQHLTACVPVPAPVEQPPGRTRTQSGPGNDGRVYRLGVFFLITDVNSITDVNHGGHENTENFS